MQAQFDKVAALVADMHADSAAARQAAETQRDDVVRVTRDVEDAIREMRAAEAKADNELRDIRGEVDTVKEMLPKVGLTQTGQKSYAYYHCTDDGQDTRSADTEFVRAACRACQPQIPTPHPRPWPGIGHVVTCPSCSAYSSAVDSVVAAG